MTISGIEKLTPFDAEGELLNVIIETPQGSSVKYTFHPESGLFKLGGVMPAGHLFPYDFGFVPGTLGGDGDPLDVLLLMETPAVVGAWVPARLVGGFEAEQTELDGRRERNDRLIAVADSSLVYSKIHSLKDIDTTLLEQIKHFFVSYNDAKGKKFDIGKRLSPRNAAALVKRSIVRGKA